MNRIDLINIERMKGGYKLAKLALILGMILTTLTIIEKVLVIHEK
ncbi:hypothetical protein MC28_G374 (plasmid) [Bacillus thuringiensis MC28]|nr:hypothetical protein MC28_G374 [Bacillus thuringiensis MC28]